MPTDRAVPENTHRMNDFATKRDVLRAVKNMTQADFAIIDARLAKLETPWWKRLFR